MGVVPHDPGLDGVHAHRVVRAHRVAILCAGRVATGGQPGGVFAERPLSEVHDQPFEVIPHPERSLPGDPETESLNLL
ncbi:MULTISPECIES: hypothetical protein [unclassified Streptomyces]|uniref:hypothetical protein n=1 Tax=unclassified Streptomyces TaxID=2593676 RepID=UPI0033A3DD02